LEPTNLSPTRSSKASNLGSEWLGLVRGMEEERRGEEREGPKEGGRKAKG